MAYGFNDDKTKQEMPEVIVEEQSMQSSSIAKATTGTITVSKDVAKEGYTPIGIVGFNARYGSATVSWATWGTPFTFGGFEIVGTTARVYYNKYKSAEEAGALYITVKVLYKKNV